MHVVGHGQSIQIRLTASPWWALGKESSAWFMVITVLHGNNTGANSTSPTAPPHAQHDVTEPLGPIARTMYRMKSYFGIVQHFVRLYKMQKAPCMPICPSTYTRKPALVELFSLAASTLLALQAPTSFQGQVNPQPVKSRPIGSPMAVFSVSKILGI